MRSNASQSISITEPVTKFEPDGRIQDRIVHRRLKVMGFGLLALLTVGAVGLPASGQTAPTGPEPSVSTTLGVYADHDGGAGCSAATSFLEGSVTAPVTYCIVVTNSGETHLASVDVSIPSVTGNAIASPTNTPILAPGESAGFFIETVPPADDADGLVDETHIATSMVSAVPVAADGTHTGAPPVTAEAETSVFPTEEAVVAGLSLASSVYAGHDGGAGCGTASDQVVADVSAQITLCYTITNTGNTPLNSLSVVDPDFANQPQLLSADSTPLAAGGKAVFFLDSSAPALGPEGLKSNATANANPVDDTGADLTGMTDVVASAGITLNTPPTELAFTGWESWLIAMIGVGILAAGGAMMLDPQAKLAVAGSPVLGKPVVPSMRPTDFDSSLPEGRSVRVGVPVTRPPMRRPSKANQTNQAK